ncbi:MAG: hypothetical protein DRQ40_08630, partial [Gammaproteobacteria bacterium]
MAGLLDSGMMKLLFGGTEYMRNKRKDEVAGQVQGLIGQVGESVGQGPKRPMGILGDNPTPEQFNTRMGQGLMGIPGYEQQGTSLLNQMSVNRRSAFNNMNTNRQLGMNNAASNRQSGMNNAASNTRSGMNNAANNMRSGMNNQNTIQGAMDRQTQEQDYSYKDMTAYQRGMLEKDWASVKATMANNQFNRVETLQGKWDTEVRQYEPVVQAAQSFDDVVKQAGGYNNLVGSEQLLGMIKFMKTATGGEAFMGDDMRNVAQSAGFMGKASDMWAWITTAGFKDKDVVRKMHEVMQEQAMVNQRKIDAQVTNLRAAFPGMNNQTETQ